MPGLSSATDWRKSITGDDRAAVAIAAKAVVEANGDHVHVLGNSTDRADKRGIHDPREDNIPAAHEQVVVLKADRPVR